MVEFKRPDTRTWVVEEFAEGHTLVFRVIGFWVEIRLNCADETLYQIQRARRRYDNLKGVDIVPHVGGFCVAVHFGHVLDFGGSGYAELGSVDFKSEQDAEQFADTIQAAFDLASTYARR